TLNVSGPPTGPSIRVPAFGPTITALVGSVICPPSFGLATILTPARASDLPARPRPQQARSGTRDRLVTTTSGRWFDAPHSCHDGPLVAVAEAPGSRGLQGCCR